MKKNIILALLILASTSVISVVIAKKYIYKEENSSVAPSVVIPRFNSESQTSAQNISMEDDDSALVSLIPLRSDETLLNILGMDFDGDGFDDQVNAVRTMDSPYISLIVGLYNPKRSVYERKTEIITEIIQVQTFSYTSLDITGDHSNALIYQGFSESGDSILKAYHIKNENDKFELITIASLSGDEAIFIQQMDRYDAYERSKAKGASFPIWVYTTDAENEKSSDQLQILYEWNPKENQYVKTKTIRVAGSNIAAKELAKIQDNTVETFANFLEGLWYMNEIDGSGVRYLFFNFASKEIIFFKDDTEEVYIWAHSNLRRNGISISTINQEIENLKRRVDISLKSIEEIHIRIQDDVRMRISEETVWDGGYKKINQNLYKSKMKLAKKTNEIALEFEKVKSWKTSEGYVIKISNGKYSVVGENIFDEGIYFWNENRQDNMIQFRSLKDKNSIFSGLYKVSEEENQEKEKSYSMQPCKIYADGIIMLDQRPIVITEVLEKE